MGRCARERRAVGGPGHLPPLPGTGGQRRPRRGRNRPRRPGLRRRHPAGPRRRRGRRACPGPLRPHDRGAVNPPRHPPLQQAAPRRRGRRELPHLPRGARGPDASSGRGGQARRRRPGRQPHPLRGRGRHRRGPHRLPGAGPAGGPVAGAATAPRRCGRRLPHRPLVPGGGGDQRPRRGLPRVGPADTWLDRADRPRVRAPLRRGPVRVRRRGPHRAGAGVRCAPGVRRRLGPAL